MTDLGRKVMESMFDAWCDGVCEEYILDHNEYGHSTDEVVQYICELTRATKEQRLRIEHELETLINTAKHNTFTDGFCIGVAVATGKIFKEK